LLAEYWLEVYNKQFLKNISLTESAKEALESLAWDGNIRQLKNFCERICAIGENGRLDGRFIRENYSQNYNYDTPFLPESITEDNKSRVKLSETVIQSMLAKYKGNKTKVARELNISRTTLWKYLKQSK